MKNRRDPTGAIVKSDAAGAPTRGSAYPVKTPARCGASIRGAVEQDRTEARDDPDADGEEHERGIAKGAGTTPSKDDREAVR